jgi:hypothetical protein
VALYFPSIWLVYGFEVALGWLWVALPGFLHSAFNLLPSLGGGLAPLFRIPHSAFRIPHSPQGVFHKHTEYNPPFPPPSGWSGGTLDIPWYHPIPIDPPQHPLFDQASLSKPLSCGFAAVPRCSGLQELIHTRAQLPEPMSPAPYTLLRRRR